MSSIRQKWSPITQNTYDDKKYRQHIAIITYLLPLGCSCVGCFREGCCMLGMCTSSTQFLHMHNWLESNMKKHFWNAFEFDITLSPLMSNLFISLGTSVAPSKIVNTYLLFIWILKGKIFAKNLHTVLGEFNCWIVKKRQKLIFFYVKNHSKISDCFEIKNDSLGAHKVIFFDNFNFWRMPNFGRTVEVTKYSSFLWLCWFLAENLAF